MEIVANVPLHDWTWWKIGGAADFFCLPATVIELREAITVARARRLPITILGGGTNVLVSDRGVEGLVIGMKNISGLQSEERGGRIQITALAGTAKSELTKIFLKARLAPSLFLCGLPGDIGGGVVMNAGIAEAVIPREFGEIVDWIEVVDLDSATLEVKRFSKADVEWTYRTSLGWQPGVVVRAQISWEMVPDTEIPRKVKEATRNRLQRQPLEWPSCGSTFKNPLPQTAGALIDEAGLKGFQIGSAQVSPKHANFIVNLGGARADDVLAVIRHVQAEVQKRFAVELETEVRFVGRW